MSNLDSRIIEIKSKLEAARLLAPDVFGASGHKWKVNEAIARGELRRIEELFNIRLPEEYRSFLQQVGNGGAGPAYGVKPLGESVRYFIERGYLDVLTREFPHTAFFNDCNNPFLAESEQRSYRGEITEDELDRIYCYADSGVIDICDLGCGYSIKLVITGPTRGQVWEDDSAADCGVTPLGVSYLDWYDEWLEKCLEGYS